MILQQYIQEVLYRQQTCCLPRIGVFSLQYIPARYNDATGAIEPPGQLITFDATRTDDDGSFAEWIALREQLVPAIAQRKMDKYINEFKNILQTGHPSVIQGIGQLQADAPGRISFLPETVPVKKEALYLQPVSGAHASKQPETPPAISPAVVTATPLPQEPPAPVAKREEPQDTYVPVSPAPTAKVETSPPAIPAAPALQAQQEQAEAAPAYPDYPDFPESPSSFRWWWVAIPLAAVVAGIIWWGTSGDNPPPPVAAPVPIAATTTVDTMDMRQDIQQADAMPHVNAVQDSDTMQYYVVIETFHDRESADKKYNKRKKLWGQKEITLLYKSTDSSTVMLAIPFRSLPADTTKNKEKVRIAYGGNVHLEF